MLLISGDDFQSQPISGDDFQSQLNCDPHFWHQFLAFPLDERDVQNTVTHIECEDTDHISDSSHESVVIPPCNTSSRELAKAVKDRGSHVS